MWKMSDERADANPSNRNSTVTTSSGGNGLDNSWIMEVGAHEQRDVKRDDQDEELLVLERGGEEEMEVDDDEALSVVTDPTFNAERDTISSQGMDAEEPELIMPSSRSWISTDTPPCNTTSSPSSLNPLATSSTTSRSLSSGTHTTTLSSEAEENSSQLRRTIVGGTNEQRQATQILSSGPAVDYLRLLRANIPFTAFIAAIWLVPILLQLGAIPASALRPLLSLCHAPLVSSLNLTACELSRTPAQADFDQLMSVQSTLEDVLSSATVSANVPRIMKQSEASIRDLKVLVEHSELPGRNELLLELNEFISDARVASWELTRFNSHIGKTIDQVLSINRWTLRVIDGISDSDASSGWLQRTLFAQKHVSERLLLEQYLRHTDALEDQIERLIIEAQTLLVTLQSLDDQLDTIQSIAARDGVEVQGTREELLAQLWTRLGGNRASRKKLEEQLRLLGVVDTYRKIAWDHVTTTMLKLQEMSIGLEDLRERVAAPDVLGGKSIPLQVHVEIVQRSLERLREQRLDAKHEEEVRRLEGHDRLERYIEHGTDTVELHAATAATI